ncbi:uncharacterized protein LOC132846409 [Tachysurus vachellii]|uniref:uncharacterized protein LOC132846409 n=1 Tax=Tachysurus vachellii TaxID=175792 RepID=UPI00296ACFFF|nr:uncharacterized protein LOC132846409 [Tachysurus vachellii]XP_060727112.1 uncharacterized protein LOC132846409 [Tachysurus vachellii]
MEKEMVFTLYTNLMWMYKYKKDLFNKQYMVHNADAQPNNSLDPLWLMNEMIEEYSKRLESTNSPVVYKNGEILEYNADMELVIPKETPCIIIIRHDKKYILNGLGCYYGCDYALTALHVVNYLHLGILIAFPTKDVKLIYKAEFTKCCNRDKDRDQAYIKLLGNTSPLGDGLQNQIVEMDINDSIYFYTRDPNGNFQKQEGVILYQYPSKFFMSVAGKPGDSGSPVFNSKHELIGIYHGVYKDYGVTCNTFPSLTPGVQTNDRSLTELLRDVMFHLLHKFKLVPSFFGKLLRNSFLKCLKKYLNNK